MPAPADDEQLRKLGYAQQLLRELGGFGNFAISFSTISILTGAVTLYGHGLRFGGPFVMTVGWPLVTAMTLLVALSLAELASAYPTAGALYHWASILGGPGWGYFTAWLNAIALFAIIAGVDYGLSEFVAAAFQWQSRAAVLAIYAVILLSHALLNHVGVRAVNALSSLSAWYHVGATLVLIGAILTIAPKQSASFLMIRQTAESHSYLYAFLVALLQAQWTFTGYEASAHVSEETKDASRAAPRGIILSVVISGLAGYVLLIVATLAIPNLQRLTSTPADTEFAALLTAALGERLGAAMTWLCVGAMWFCGLASVTSASRMVFAFARDGGTPYSKQLSAVSPRFRTPHWAIWVSVAVAFAIAIWSSAYSAIVALSTLAFYASYAIPIALNVRASSRGVPLKRGAFSLGGASRPVAMTALAWIGFITVLFVLPPDELAGYTFAGGLALIAVDWFARKRRSFSGPPELEPGR